MAFALGSFVDGLFSGAKSTMDLIDTKRKMDDAQAVRDATEAVRVQANADVEAGSSAKTFTATLGNYGGGDDTGTAGTTGSSTPPVPTEIKEGVTGTRSPTARNAGAPELTDYIAPLVSKHESSDRPYIGYTPENATPEQKARAVDLSKNPAMPGYFGFPQWEGNPGPAGISHAAGLYQFEPDTWKAYAGPLGVTDFSPESQRKVFDAAYLDQGIRPWTSNRTLISALAAAPGPGGTVGLLGGAATSAARAGAGQPSALGVPTATTAQPDMEVQRDKAQTGQAPTNTATSVVRSILGSGAPAQQATVPDATTQPSPIPYQPGPNLRAAIEEQRSAATRGFTPTPSVDPVAAAVATSAMSPTPAATPSSPAPVTVTPPPQRPFLSQLRQMQADQAEGRSSVFPPGQQFNSRGEAVSQDIGRALPGQQGLSPSGAVQRSFAAANKIIRLPDGTMVDGIGNVVRQAPSALYPR